VAVVVVMMVVTPSAVMHLGTGIEIGTVTVLYHDGFSTGDRRRHDGDRAKYCNNVSKLLHAVFLG